MNNLVSKFKNCSTKVKTFALTSGMVLVPVAATHAAGLDEATTTAITSGFTDAGTAIATVVGLGVTATVGVIAMSGGAKAGLKWIKGVFSKAS